LLKIFPVSFLNIVNLLNLKHYQNTPVENIKQELFGSLRQDGLNCNEF